METTKFIIEEVGLKKQASKEFIIKLINDQISTCRLEYLSQWERDHSTTTELKDKKIESLQNKKKELEDFFDNDSSLNASSNLNISIQLNTAHD